MKMEKTYKPGEFESSLYGFWERKKLFHAVIDKSKEPFSIVIPPPNITGQLHMGHALNNTIQDIVIRFKRMQGFCTLWLPGTDHASIATEVKIVEAMALENLSKKDVGREGFLERAWEWKKRYGGRIVEQLKKLGSSCDWDREAFTMDERCSKAVKRVFIDLYRKGLIYRGDRIINWCPSCKTAISDAEVDYAEQDSYLWHIRYPLLDGSGEIVVATTRPETMLGDTAVAVHPEDKRYSHMVGKMLILPLVNKEIPIIADEYVEKDFGSGAVKITPAHDSNDFEVGLRHNLEVVRVMNDDGTMNGFYKKYEGMDRYKAREAIERDLNEGKYLVKKENYKHNVGECYRCRTTIETIVSKQWFVKMQPLADPAIQVVKKKKIRFIPERFAKTYFNWMENIKDWCISRQLWWGHRIPAYYCESCGNTIVCEDIPTVCTKCGGALRQDEDVLDTWFSSALWPFSTMGYPDKTPDLEYFYPTNVLITAYDIIFFWVARMIFSGLEHMHEIPFPEVLIHGIVRDELGRKMSKSLGNGVDPLEVIESYGADSLRFSLSNGIATGGDTRFSIEKVESCRNFINKIWNASRFVLMNLEGVTLKDICSVNKTIADKWMLSRLNQVIRSVTKNLEKYEIGIAAGKLYDFVWSEFCDWYIELVKPALYKDEPSKKADTLTVLVHVLTEILKLLHPYIPFVTEHIYQSLPNTGETIMTATWPKQQKKFAYTKDAKQFEGIMEIIRTIRNIRAEVGVTPSKRINIMLVAPESKGIIAKCHDYIEKLAGVDAISYITHEDAPEKASTAVTRLAEIYINLGELVDTEKEIQRLSAEIEKIDKEIERAKKMLDNKGFVQRAPQAVVDAERGKLLAFRDKRDKLTERLALLR